jgi:hypothetical protein
VDGREFPAAEDRRHLANVAVTVDATPSWSVGGSLRGATGAPYTRLTLVDTDCVAALGCQRDTPVLVGLPGLQRTRAYLSLDLATEWTHAFRHWSLSVYGQLRNVLGRDNAVTYHSSCLCVTDGAASGPGLHDEFDSGLARIPLVGLRVRF